MSTKSRVLSALEKNRGRSLSGQELADALGVSRTAVWKAVKALREEGHAVDAVPKAGYRLLPQSDRLSPEGVTAALPEALRGLPIFVYETLDSTNTQARRMALEGAAHGTAVLAEEQSAGRGRSGHSFFSPKGAGLYLSLILRPRETGMTDVQLLTVAAAVAVCRAIETLCGVSPRIKWVNDLYWNGKKVCGILTEAVSDFESGQIESLVLGVGVNCTAAPLPPELEGAAGDLGAAGLNRSRLAAAIVENVLTLSKSLGDPALIREYRDRSLMLGKAVTFGPDGDEEAGTVLDINDAGNLIVRDDRGRIRALSSGQVRIRGSW